jgi:hypothetical protein
LNGVGAGVGVGAAVVRVGVGAAAVGAAATDVGVALDAVVGVADFGPTMLYRTKSPTMTRIA